MAVECDILLVEDNPDDAALTLRALSRHNLANRVQVARDGVEAFECLRDRSRPKVILLDLKLPRISGLEVLERLKADAETRTIPVVVLTSSREEPDIARAYALGANSYIVKPVDFNQFTDQVAVLGQYWTRVNRTFG
jgi:CheY-like chemotaxis protein